jgi:hypothetical protein
MVIEELYLMKMDEGSVASAALQTETAGLRASAKRWW